jgi:hypothetical protein
MTRHLSALLTVLFALLVTLAPSQATPAAAQGERCFPETGFCISGPIRTYWERNGGLPVFGFPISAQSQISVEGRTVQAQWFERDRIEIQPNGQVTTGRLGVEYLQVKRGEQVRNGTVYTPDRACIVTNPATGHQICGAFANYWQRNGGIERFGLPVTGERVETINGQQLTVQYFERRRFELHGGQVLLGLLGRELVPVPGPVGCPTTPANLNAIIEPGCGPRGTVLIAAGGGFRPDEVVGLYITTPNQSVFGAGFQIKADNQGRVVWTIDTGAIPPDYPMDGVWAITFEGTKSGARAVAYFTVQR